MSPSVPCSPTPCDNWKSVPAPLQDHSLHMGSRCHLFSPSQEADSWAVLPPLPSLNSPSEWDYFTCLYCLPSFQIHLLTSYAHPTSVPFISLLLLPQFPFILNPLQKPSQPRKWSLGWEIMCQDKMEKHKRAWVPSDSEERWYQPWSTPLQASIFFFNFFWLCWVFVAARRLSLVEASGGYSSLQCSAFSLWWLLLLQSTGSRRVGFSSCSTRPQ